MRSCSVCPLDAFYVGTRLRPAPVWVGTGNFVVINVVINVSVVMVVLHLIECDLVALVFLSCFMLERRLDQLLCGHERRNCGYIWHLNPTNIIINIYLGLYVWLCLAFKG